MYALDGREEKAESGGPEEHKPCCFFLFLICEGRTRCSPLLRLFMESTWLLLYASESSSTSSISSFIIFSSSIKVFIAGNSSFSIISKVYSTWAKWFTLIFVAVHVDRLTSSTAKAGIIFWSEITSEFVSPTRTVII